MDTLQLERKQSKKFRIRDGGCFWDEFTERITNGYRMKFPGFTKVLAWKKDEAGRQVFVLCINPYFAITADADGEDGDLFIQAHQMAGQDNLFRHYVNTLETVMVRLFPEQVLRQDRAGRRHKVG